MIPAYFQDKTMLSYHWRALQGNTNLHPLLCKSHSVGSMMRKPLSFSFSPTYNLACTGGENCLTALQLLPIISLMSICQQTSAAKPISRRDLGAKRHFWNVFVPCQNSNTLKNYNSLRRWNVFQLVSLSCPISSVFETGGAVHLLLESVVLSGKGAGSCRSMSHKKTSTEKHQHRSQVPNTLKYNIRQWWRLLPHCHNKNNTLYSTCWTFCIASFNQLHLKLSSKVGWWLTDRKTRPERCCNFSKVIKKPSGTVRNEIQVSWIII